MKIITFQKFSWNHMLFLAYFIISFCRRLLILEIFDYEPEKSGYFCIMYNNILSHILAIIPHMISKYLSKRKNKEKEKQSEGIIEYIYHKNFFKGRNIFKSTLLVSVFDFSAEAIIFLFYFINNKHKVIYYYSLNSYLIFNTVTQYLGSYFVLKTYFYKHHYLSFLINSVCILIALTLDIIFIVEDGIVEYQYYIFIIIRLIRLVLFSFGDNFSKIALNSAFLSSYSLLIYKAIYETVFLIIFSIPFIFIKMSEKYVDNTSIFVGFSGYLTGINILYIILLFICDFLYDLNLLLIIDKFSPSHLTLAYILESLGNTVYRLISYPLRGKEISWTMYYNFILYIVLLFGAMIHNEIFIINICGLNLKTQLFLNQDFKAEFSDLDTQKEDNDEEEDEEKNEENKDKLITKEEIY